MRLVFEWDERKARHNRVKHKVSFDEAKTIFGDISLVTLPDYFHSYEEKRFISIGTSSKDRVILVVHTEFEEAGTIVLRLINARKATSAERRVYEEEKH